MSKEPVIDVYDAIRSANNLLPGESATEDMLDPRWQAIIAVGEFIQIEPQPVWEFVVAWGNYPQEDLRAAIATCLLEHLLDSSFATYFPLVEQQAKADSLFADMFTKCWKCGQAEEPYNATRFDRLQSYCRKSSPVV